MFRTQKRKLKHTYKMIIEIKEGVFYDTGKTFEEQSDKFKAYFWAEYEKVPKIPYPDFDAEGNISYYFTDNILNYSVKRVQNHPFSTSDRSIKKLVITINII